MTIEDVLKKLNVDPNLGLSKEEVEDRQKSGLNELEEQKKKSLFFRFLEQFKDLLIIILIIAAIVSAIIDPSDLTESIIIFVVVLINAFLGVYQESKAERSMEALMKLSSPLSKVIRNKKVEQIESRLLVPGDVIIVEAGDFVPADARLLESANLKIDESALTGESVPVEKESGEIKEVQALGDRKNEIFSSTYVTYGRAKAVVTSTGMKTEIGKIAGMLSGHKESLTPLQVKLNQIGKIIGFLAIGICIIVFLIEWLAIYPNDPLEAFKSSVALAVAAVPEGLSTVVVVVLSIGVQKMVRRNAIIKKLPAVETLGATQIVCSDKTGTLTQNRMTVVKVYRDELKTIEDLNDSEKELLSLFALCTDASIDYSDGKEVRIGDPTETALLDVNEKYGLYKGEELKSFNRLGELSFDSERKMMTVIINYGDKILSITKGAPDIILKNSKNIDQEKVLKINEEMAEGALRVLGLGVRELNVLPEHFGFEIEKDLDFIGLVGMIDPARPEVKKAIELAKAAGIRTIMITGDHVITAKAIARELEILGPGELSISSSELSNLSDDELYQNIEKYSVYARVAPEDKVRIVEAWQKRGMVVAMTGDGVNDSPALKKADIGCAMGVVGTDVSKEAAAMILTDDNFSTIISAVEEGRGIYANIKKTVQYLLSSNIGEVLTIFLASLITALKLTEIPFGLPLASIHLLWINLITDTLPAFALGMEKVDPDVMKQKPRPKNESFFAHGLGFRIILQGIIIGLITLFAYAIGVFQNNNPDSQRHGQTMAFLTLAMIQLFHSFNVKSERSIFNKHLFNNPFLWLSFFLGLSLQFAIIYIKPLASFFRVIPLSLNNVLISIGLAFLIIPIIEIIKKLSGMIKNQ
jgi:Ca2+-transporting ATPase